MRTFKSCFEVVGFKKLKDHYMSDGMRYQVYNGPAGQIGVHKYRNQARYDIQLGFLDFPVAEAETELIRIRDIVAEDPCVGTALDFYNGCKKYAERKQ